MKSKLLVVLGSAAMIFAVVQSAAATEKRDTRKVTSHHVSTRAMTSDARVRGSYAYDEVRPAVPAAAFDEAARYRGGFSAPAGH